MSIEAAKSIPTTPTTMVNLTIDGIAVVVPKGTTVYTAAKQLGIDIPIFCYQDRMPPFGACRMCLVEVEKMPKLQTSCTLEVAEGIVVKTQTQIALEGREAILEFLLINHPLDCPICDRGGECPLQDQTLKHGPGESRFCEEKRHFTKPKPLGPVLMLDRERCIVCARCTRFGDIVAGDNALELLERGYKTEVGTPGGGPAESKFIGNTIMICPVGALTSQVYRFRARPWDNDSTESSCTLCPVGCSMILDARDGEIMRTRSLENRPVNDIWLCDKGWFGYEFSSHPERLNQPLVRRNGKLEPASWEEALKRVAEQLQQAKPSGKVAAFGGNPLTTEENFLFQKLMREGMNVSNLDHRIGMPILTPDEEGLASGMEMEIGACEELSFALLAGIDLTEEFPLIWLRLKKAIDKGAEVHFTGHFAPEIAAHLTSTFLHAPGKELEMLKQQLPRLAKFVEGGKKGAIFVGRQYLSSSNRLSVLAELQKLRSTHVSLNLLEGRGNSFGARLAGMRPDLGPLAAKLQKPGLNAHQVLQESAKTGWSFLYVAGANPAQKVPTKLWKEARKGLEFLVVQDLFLNETAQDADVVLPTQSFVEKEGHFVNVEGRVQSLRPGKAPFSNSLSDGEIFKRLAHLMNFKLEIDAAFLDTLKKNRLPLQRPEIQLTNPSQANPSGTSAGPLSATFAPALFDHGVRMKHNPHVVQLAKEPRIRVHPSEAAKRGIQNGSRVRVSANGNAIVGKVRIDKQVAEGTVVLPLGFEAIPARELGPNLINGMKIEIEKEAS